MECITYRILIARNTAPVLKQIYQPDKIGSKPIIMKTENILKSDLLDLIFEKRNKAYGAYDLRKFYNRRLVKSIGLTVGAVGILSAFTFLPTRKTVLDKTFVETEWAHIPEYKAEPEKPKAEPLPKEPVKEVKTNETKFTKEIVIVKKTDSSDVINEIKEHVNIGSVTHIDPGTPLIAVVVPAGTPTGGPVPTGTGTGIPKTDITIPVSDPEVMPSYPGGIEALRRFLSKNLTNPEDLEQGQSVNVKIRFVVNYDGNLQSFVTAQDGGEAFNKEVVRVLKKMPQWVPGKTNGQNVAVYYTIPVKFMPYE
jgi:periplasmic protein TonB